MDRYLRRQISLIVFILLIILIPIIFGVIRIFFNYGYVEITSDPPFEIVLEDGNKIRCITNSCKIRHKTGDTDLIITKENHNSEIIGLFTRLWKNHHFQVDLYLKPYLLETESIPKSISYYKNFELINDEKGNGLQLIDTEKTITYFPQKIVNPKIYGTKDKALITGLKNKINVVYLVDITTQTKEIIENAPQITNGLWSPDSRFFISTDEKEQVWLMKDKQFIKTDLAVPNIRYAWTEESDILFAYPLGNQQSNNLYKFGIFQPEGGIVYYGDYELNSPPKNLTKLAGSNKIYFRTDKNYMLVIGN